MTELRTAGLSPLLRAPAGTPALAAWTQLEYRCQGVVAVRPTAEEARALLAKCEESPRSPRSVRWTLPFS